MAPKDRERKEHSPEEQAARHHDGQDQEPIQSHPDSSTLWDSDEHSDAPGPFGTGSE